MKQLPSNVDTVINELIEHKRKQDKLESLFPNRLLRDDVLSLLNNYCKVLYYPLPNESNNGFHITGIPDKNGKEYNFVYINTAQTIEKQAFTAAHELGHVWDVFKYIVDKLPELGNENEETIINRFAADLLMPNDLFVSIFNDKYKTHRSKDGSILLSDFLGLVADLMNLFFVPPKAVIYRLFELNYISEKTLDRMTCALSDKIVLDYLRFILQEKGLNKFLNADNKIYIDGLADLLDKAEEEKLLSLKKINHLRHMFELPEKQEEKLPFEARIDVSPK